ncbi:MAG: LPS export ABC transporter periplasmic protein LptC [Sphingomonadales bacterium]|nr:LPS export ABC transporter periplasmic protein LptC [Sphingomonadales bacterium]
MTEAADIIRDKRRHWAAPGGSHDRKVRILARWLPGLVGVVAAAMIVGPLFTEGELSFLLDRNKVAVTEERLRVTNAMYRGEDGQGRPFTVTAGSAVQVSAREPVVRMENIAARIRLSDGPAELTAARGAYDYSAQTVQADGPVQFTAADGYRLSTANVLIDLRQRKVWGSGGVSGAVPAGTFSADRVSADLDSRVLMLDGNVRLRIDQTSFRIPR